MIDRDSKNILGPLIILSTGRSGSTYAQRVLNSCPNAFIFGEHGGVIGQAARIISIMNINSADQIRNSDAILRNETAKSFIAWATPFTESAFDSKLGEVLKALYTEKIRCESGKAVWGFKEIRYDGGDLAKLIHLFPEARVLILIRDFPGYAKSCHQTFLANKMISHEEVLDILATYVFIYSSLAAACNSFAIKFRVLSYEDAKNDWRNIISLTNELLAPFELQADPAAAKQAASIQVGSRDRRLDTSPASLHFDQVLREVLSAGGTERLDFLRKHLSLETMFPGTSFSTMYEREASHACAYADIGLQMPPHGLFQKAKAWLRGKSGHTSPQKYF